ncbi:C-type lectin domain family 6 member A-like [Electrophorus electricus]|uniref:C-type lectin domain-containing protein n=1 Tax=Electrophorus electricus TaxID=8005 RepID=A0AAY5ESP4_ELEEL|nr:C-type lectin domain family 6 member A-like [Electrophorus electricus]
MENVYANVDLELSQISAKKRYQGSTDPSEHTSMPLRRMDSACLARTLMGLLLSALVAVCILAILYFNNVNSFKTLHEQYDKLLMKEDNATGCKKYGFCEEGWKSLGVKCYYFSTVKLNWTQSQDHCVEKGGYLVIITSQTEQDVISTHIWENHWIGLNDMQTEGIWMWVNNEPLNATGVTFWHHHVTGQYEPDDWKIEDPSGEDCASLGNGISYINNWFDASCRKLKQFVCEKENISF